MLKKGYFVKVIDRFIYGNFLKKDKNLTIVEKDIRDNNLYEDLIGMDAIFHLAGVSNDPGNGITDDIGTEINYQATTNIFELSAKAGISLFIYPSSCSVYGNLNLKVVNEGSPVKPLSNYAVTKYNCEKYIKSNKNDLKWVIFRPATVYGVSERQRFDLLVNRIFNNIYNLGVVDERAIKSIRPTVHIRDLVNIYIQALEIDINAINQQVINIAFDNIKVLDIIRKFDSKFIYSIDTSFKNNPLLDLRSYNVDCSKLKMIFNYTQKYTLEDGIDELYKAFLDNKYINSLNNDIYYNAKMQSKLLNKK